MKKITQTLVGNSPAVKNLRNAIEGISGLNDPVLISGELGTGKHLIANLIHSNDKEYTGSLIEFNCFAIPQRLHEEKLFGYFDSEGEEFTGIIDDAEKSYLLMEYVDKLSPEAQSGLLSIILYGTYFRKNGNKPVQADLRVLAIVDKDVSKLIESNVIENQLLDKLKSIHLRVPPLKTRKMDIPLLIEHFIKEESEKSGKKPVQISPELIERFFQNDWNGNISQLKSTIMTLIVASGEENLNLILFPEFDGQESSDILISLYQQFAEKLPSLKEFRDSMESALIKFALNECNYNVAKVGRTIGLSEAGMRRAMERLNLPTKRQMKKNLA